MSLSYGRRIIFDMNVGGHLIPMDANNAYIALGQFMVQTFTIRVPPHANVKAFQFPVHQRWTTRATAIWPIDDSTQAIWPPADPIADLSEFEAFINRFVTGPRFVT